MMRSLIAALRSLVLPNGATSGQRIVLDADNGVILVYDSSNDLIASIAPTNDPGGQWVSGITSYEYPGGAGSGIGSYVEVADSTITFGPWNGRPAYARNGFIQVDDSGITAPVVLTIRTPSDDPPNGHSVALTLWSQYNDGTGITPPVAIINDDSFTLDVATDLIVSGYVYTRGNRTDAHNGLFTTPVRETWHTPVLLSGWTQDAGSLPIGYKIDSGGWVRLRGGLLAGTKTDGTVIMSLPAPYRPAKDVLGLITRNGLAGAARYIVRHATGNLEIYDVSTAGGLVFDQACYSAPDQQ